MIYFNSIYNHTSVSENVTISTVTILTWQYLLQSQAESVYIIIPHIQIQINMGLAGGSFSEINLTALIHNNWFKVCLFKSWFSV